MQQCHGHVELSQAQTNEVISLVGRWDLGLYGIRSNGPAGNGGMSMEDFIVVDK